MWQCQKCGDVSVYNGVPSECAKCGSGSGVSDATAIQSISIPRAELEELCRELENAQESYEHQLRATAARFRQKYLKP